MKPAVQSLRRLILNSSVYNTVPNYVYRDSFRVIEKSPLPPCHLGLEFGWAAWGLYRVADFSLSMPLSVVYLVFSGCAVCLSSDFFKNDVLMVIVHFGCVGN